MQGAELHKDTVYGGAKELHRSTVCRGEGRAGKGAREHIVDRV
jgi:hypothetical protein